MNFIEYLNRKLNIINRITIGMEMMKSEKAKKKIVIYKTKYRTARMPQKAGIEISSSMSFFRARQL